MKLQVKTTTILWLLLCMVLLNDTHIFYFSSQNHFYQLILAVVMLVITLFLSAGTKSWLEEMPYINNICIITVICFAGVYVLSLFAYSDQTLWRTLIGDSAHYKMLLIILVIPLAYLCWIEGGTRNIFRLLNAFSVVIYVTTLIQYVVYTASGQIFLTGHFLYSTNYTYNGTLKMGLSWFAYIMIIYNFYMYGNYDYSEEDRPNRKRMWHLVLFLTGYLELLLIARVRGYIIAVTLCLIYLILFNKNTLRGFGHKVLLALILAILVFGTSVFTDFFSSFSEEAARGYSTTARMYAYNYYWTYFLEHPLYGFGFADYLTHYSLIHGNGMAAISDVGIVGQLAKYGLFLIPIYIAPMLRMGWILLRTKDSSFVKNRMFFVALYIYLLATTPTLIAISQGNALSWPFMLVALEFVNLADRQGVVYNEL